MKIVKKIALAIFVIICFLFMTCEPTEPTGELTPYMSDLTENIIPTKTYAKGKAKKVTKKQLKAYKSLGKFTLTAYCGCSRCCGKSDGVTASGKKAKANHTIAVDKKKIPLGTEVVINKVKYVAEDTGGGIKGNHIDIYFDSHSEALDFGRQKATVYIRRK